MDGETHTCLRVLGVLLIVLLFSFQSQAAFSTKPATDLTSAIESARQELRATILIYETTFQQRLAMEDGWFNENTVPNYNLVAATRELKQ